LLNYHLLNLAVSRVTRSLISAIVLVVIIDVFSGIHVEVNTSSLNAEAQSLNHCKDGQGR